MPEITFKPTEENESIKVGEIYFRFHEKSSLMVVGHWDNGDIDYLGINDLIKIREFLTHCIIRDKVKKIKVK